MPDENENLDGDILGGNPSGDELNGADESAQDNDTGGEPSGGTENSGDQAGGDETAEITLTAEDIASTFGVDADLLSIDDKGQVFIKSLGEDGAESSVSFADIMSAHKGNIDLTEKSGEVVKLQQGLQSQLETQQTEHVQALNKLGDITLIAMQELAGEVDSIDWATLRTTDPGEYAAKQAELSQRSELLQNRLAAIDQKRQESVTAAQSQYMKSAKEELVKAIPAWADDKVMEKEQGELIAYSTKIIGYSEQDAKVGTMNPLNVEVLRKAMAYDKLKAGNPGKAKLVRIASKTSAPGNSGSDDGPVDDAKLFYG